MAVSGENGGDRLTADRSWTCVSDGSGTFRVWNNSTGPAHFILDVNGYFQKVSDRPETASLPNRVTRNRHEFSDGRRASVHRRPAHRLDDLALLVADDRDRAALLLLQEENGLPLRVVLVDGVEDAGQELGLDLRLGQAFLDLVPGA